MLILTVNPAMVLLQISPQNLDGTAKTSLSLAQVRVYYVVDDVEINNLATTNLVHISASKVWRYTWEPTSLDVGQYIVEFTLTDDEETSVVALEDIIITRNPPSVVEIDTQLTSSHGTGAWRTAPAITPRIVPGEGE